MQVNFIDVGCHKGGVCQMMIDIAEKLNLEYELHAFDACKEMADKCKERFKDNPNVTVINKAISDKYETVKLYHAKRMLGNSIFSTKGNVKETDYEEVEAIKLSDYILTNLDLSNINILKSNCEGAEILLFNDLIDTGYYKYIDLFIGNQCSDINKIAELAHVKDSFFKKIEDADIEMHYFSNTKYGTRKGGNVNLEAMIRELL